jgi:hypothetical protein
MTYLVGSCVDFKAYAPGPGHFHAILHDNKLKLGTTMGFTIVNIVATEKIIVGPFSKC